MVCCHRTVRRTCTRTVVRMVILRVAIGRWPSSFREDKSPSHSRTESGPRLAQHDRRSRTRHKNIRSTRRLLFGVEIVLVRAPCDGAARSCECHPDYVRRMTARCPFADGDSLGSPRRESVCAVPRQLTGWPLGARRAGHGSWRNRDARAPERGRLCVSLRPRDSPFRSAHRSCGHRTPRRGGLFTEAICGRCPSMHGAEVIVQQRHVPARDLDR
jgi:hypothetical protein